MTLWAKRIGMATGVGGAVLLAANVGNVALAYGVMSVSTVAWSLVAIRQRDGYLLAVNLAYGAINLFGLYRWFAG